VRVAKPTQDRKGARAPSAEERITADGQWGASPADEIASGSVLGGKYRLISEIGRGGMGSVWRAQHLGWEAPVALKIMNRDITAHPEAVARFEREVRLAAGLRSPHVVQVLDHGVDEATQTPYIAMELLEGESLARRLKRTGRLSPASTFQVFSQLARALTRAHAAGIVHRDLKPDNVFLVQNEEESLTKILDFGVAKWTAPDLSESGLTRPGSVVGTPYYMSPEQIQGAPDIDHRADLWALAAIACECLTGRRPFEAPDFAQLAVLLLGNINRPLPSSLGPVPPLFDAWFLRATDPDISRRFQSVRAMAQALAPICDVAPASFGSDSFPAPKELDATRHDVSSTAPVSSTTSLMFGGSGLLEPQGIWQRPLYKLAATTALTTLLVTGSLVWFFRRPPEVARPTVTQASPGAAPNVANKPTTGPIIRPIRPLDSQHAKAPPYPEAPVPEASLDAPGGDSLPGDSVPGDSAPGNPVSPPQVVTNDGFDPVAAQKKVRAAQLARPKTRGKGKKPPADGVSPGQAQTPSPAQSPPSPAAVQPEVAPNSAPNSAPSLVDGRHIRTTL
jgi:serine/threonine protein kinase